MTSNATPFQPPKKVFFFVECSAKGFILDKRCLLNISWMLLGSSSIMWPAGEGFVKVPGQKGRNLESDASESSFSFFPLLSFPCWENGGLRRLSDFLSKLFWYQSLLLILNLTGCFWWSKYGDQTVSETPKKVMILRMNGCKNHRPLRHGSSVLWVERLRLMNFSKQVRQSKNSSCLRNAHFYHLNSFYVVF